MGKTSLVSRSALGLPELDFALPFFPRICQQDNLPRMVMLALRRMGLRRTATTLRPLLLLPLASLAALLMVFHRQSLTTAGTDGAAAAAAAAASASEWKIEEERENLGGEVGGGNRVPYICTLRSTFELLPRLSKKNLDLAKKIYKIRYASRPTRSA